LKVGIRIKKIFIRFLNLPRIKRCLKISKNNNLKDVLKSISAKDNLNDKYFVFV
tara:strand:- start:5498 stop:5659 length:162 start_codon:yes stop_codon:yes gene_type:complete